MRASVILATPCDAGPWLEASVAACLAACDGLDAELVVAPVGPDGPSWQRARGRFPGVRFVPGEGPDGVAAAKARGVDVAAGTTLVVLDGPALPEPGSLEQLIRDAEFAAAQGVGALVAPRVLALDLALWRNGPEPPGHLGFLDLETFDRGWAAPPAERHWYHFFASPVALGGGLALSRTLYERLGGFDVALRTEGLETVDLSLRCWLQGGWVLHDPLAAVGHGFRAGPAAASPGQAEADELHLAYKVLADDSWAEWRARCRRRLGPLWGPAWAEFEGRQAHVERARAALRARAVHDTSWYAARFGPDGPASGAGPGGTGRPAPPEPGTPEAIRGGRSGRACFEDHARRPRNHGALPDANLAGTLHGADGGTVVLALKLVRQASGGVSVERAAFEGGGTPEARAYLSLLTELLEGRPLSQARALTPHDLQAVFEAGGGPEPAAGQAVAALHRALEAL